MGSGVLFVALVLSGNEIAVAFRADDLDPQIARCAFNEGQRPSPTPGHLAASLFAAAGSSRRPDFCPAAGAGFCKRSGTRTQPHQLDQLHLATLYLMFWLWVVTVAVLLLRRNFPGLTPSG